MSLQGVAGIKAKVQREPINQQPLQATYVCMYIQYIVHIQMYEISTLTRLQHVAGIEATYKLHTYVQYSTVITFKCILKYQSSLKIQFDQSINTLSIHKRHQGCSTSSLGQVNRIVIRQLGGLVVS